MGGGAPLDVGEDGEERAKGEPEVPYKKENILGMVKARGGWLTIFFVGLVEAIVRRRKGVANPWGEGATTLEWTLPSPPPFHQFNELPEVKPESHH